MRALNVPWTGWARVSIGVASIVCATVMDNAWAGNIFDDGWAPPTRPTTNPSETPVHSLLPKVDPAVTGPKPPVAIKPPAVDPAIRAGSGRPTTPGPIPTGEDQARVRKLFREVYARQLADPSAKGRKALAQQLLDDAAKTKDAPVDQFVMLVGARQAAVDAGDVESAMGADAELCKLFVVDIQGSRLELFTRLSKTARGSVSCTALSKAALRQADDAIAHGEFDVARQFVDAAVVASKGGENVALIAETNAGAANVRAVAAAYGQLDKSLAILREKPGDPEASLAVGRFYCLMVGQWPTGLGFLAAGSDAKLKAAAKADMEGSDAAAIAEQWRALADREGVIAKRHLRSRAAKWYRDAMGTLTGLARAKVEGQLAELSSGPFRPEARELKLSNKDHSNVILAGGAGLAALGSINGRFEGAAEKAGVVLADDGSWSSESESRQGEMHCSIIVYPRADGLNLNAQLKEYRWQRGEPKVKLIHRSEGFCYLSKVAGHFEAGGERVSVTIGDDGFWYLDCRTGQDLWARAISVKPKGPRILSTDFREVSWKKGEPAVKVIREDEGMCFLSLIHGGMRDKGDYAGLRLGDDGCWYLGGTGRISAVKAIVIRYLADAK